MANEENLRPSEYKLTREEAKKGGQRSGETRRKKRAMREQLELLLKLPVQNKKVKEKMSELGIDEKDIDNQMAITISLFNEAMKGNTKAYELIRDTIGEKPIDKQEIKEIKSDWFK